MTSPRLRLGIVGFGLIGRRRAQIAAEDGRAALVGVADPTPTAREIAAKQFQVPVFADAEELLNREPLDLLVVATPNSLAVPIAISALRRGLHVLIEKPPGTDAAQCRRLASAAARSGRLLKVGFNHRYHPALARLLTGVRQGEIGEVINLRAQYGHGGRPGYENEWRGRPQLSGGGELLDQGVHLLDLVHGLMGMPETVFAMLQTAVWPVHPLEDNGFALLRYPNGAVGSLHSSWTQWKNHFSLEVFGTRGALIAEGLGGSYGPERWILHRRRPEGGAPDTHEETFSGPDESWRIEWEEFLSGILHNMPYQGTPSDGLGVMTMLQALYRSARTGRAVRIAPRPAAEVVHQTN